jgi:tetratricopeptide (TPR) repeat protein
LHAVADLCNALAMQRLTSGDFDAAKALLQRAEAISDKESSLRAITYNNFACFHRRQGNLRTALQYLHSALDIESKLADAHNPSDTHLNISAIQSQLGRHELALEHAQAALVMLHDELFEHNTESTLDGSAPFPAAAPERMSVLAIAYHNMGAELEFLRRWEDALLAYKRAMQLARLHVGDANPVTRTLSQAYESARASISLKIQQRDIERGRRRAAAMPRASSGASIASGRRASRELGASAARPRSANASSLTLTFTGLPPSSPRSGRETPPRPPARSRPSSAVDSRQRLMPVQ